MATAVIVSFRLGGPDGVSVVAANWARSLERLGFEVSTVAGEGAADRLLPGLAIDAPEVPSPVELSHGLTADLVVVENLCSIPLNLAVSRAVAAALRGRPAVLHHHDPPWQRERFVHVTELPPDDPAWRHVTINELTRRQFAERGLRATTIYNGFDVDAPRGDRRASRRELDVADGERLLLHPVRAIARKNVPAAIALCEALGATYWLLGPPEEDYGPELARVLASARCRVIHRGFALADAHAACDAVVFPSTWEGFGNPPVEAAIHCRVAAVGDYPVASELAALGLRWLPSDDPEPLRSFLEQPDAELLRHNRAVVDEHLSLDALTDRIGRLLEDAGWLP